MDLNSCVGLPSLNKSRGMANSSGGKKGWVASLGLGDLRSKLRVNFTDLAPADTSFTHNIGGTVVLFRERDDFVNKGLRESKRHGGGRGKSCVARNYGRD